MAKIGTKKQNIYIDAKSRSEQISFDLLYTSSDLFHIVVPSEYQSDTEAFDGGQKKNFGIKLTRKAGLVHLVVSSSSEDETTKKFLDLMKLILNAKTVTEDVIFIEFERENKEEKDHHWASDDKYNRDGFIDMKLTFAKAVKVTVAGGNPRYFIEKRRPGFRDEEEEVNRTEINFNRVNRYIFIPYTDQSYNFLCDTYQKMLALAKALHGFTESEESINSLVQSNQKLLS